MKEYYEYLEDDLEKVCNLLEEIMSYAWFQLEADPELKDRARETLYEARK